MFSLPYNVHVSLHDARKASAIAHVASVFRVMVPDGTVVSLQGRSKYIKLSAHVKHNDVQEAIYGNQCCGAEEHYKWLRDV